MDYVYLFYFSQIPIWSRCKDQMKRYTKWQRLCKMWKKYFIICIED